MISFIIGLYNEEKRFPQKYPLLREFLETLGERWELLLVDDGSTDQTYAWISSLAEKDDKIRVLRLCRNCGQGAAVKVGMLASGGDVVLYTDADLEIPFRYFSLLIEKIRSGCDVAIASRWIPGAMIKIPQPFLRRSLGRFYYWFVHRIVFDGIYDTNCGLKAYRGQAARTIFGFVRSWRWVFNIEHLWLAHRMGYVIAEVPVEWSHNPQSKVHVFRDGLFTLWELAMMKSRRFFGGYPVLSVKR